MATSAKQRQPRLRASCDGCFLAKVKCSKARPICSRCLACGIECRYSPSSRAGKPKSADASSRHVSTPDINSSSSMVSDNIVYSVHPGAGGLYKIETGWSTPPKAMDGSMSRNHSIASELALMGVEEKPPTDHDHGLPGEMYGTGLPWTPPNDLGGPFSESPISTTLPGNHARSQSFDMTGPGMTWMDPTGQDIFSYNSVPTPASMSSNYFPSPTATPNLRPTPPRSKSTPANSTAGSCTCFTVCLQSLQALHNASSPASPPFDLVLSLNRKAVEGCAAMLACSRCMSRSGTHTAAMLLATVIGKITSFYKNASQSYFDNVSTNSTAIDPASTAAPPPGTGLGVSLGAYTLSNEDGRWLELEILARELRKLEEVYARFREVCAELSEDADVSKAMIGYLGQNLGSTLEVVTHRKGGMGFA